MRTAVVASLLLGLVSFSSSANWKLFIIAGQSNAMGYCGDSSWSGEVEPGTAYEYRYAGDSLAHLDDPLGKESTGFMKSWTGSMGPNLCNTYYGLTGDTLVIAHTAMMGSGLSPKTTDTTLNWSQDYFDRCTTIVQAAVAKTSLPVAGIIWVQGERDASSINKGMMDENDYRSALENLIAKFRAGFSDPKLPFYIVQTGTLNRAWNPALYDSVKYQADSADYGYAKVREMQTKVCFDDSFTVMIHNRAYEFAADGWMADIVHYYQNGHNEIGKVGAQNIYRFEQYGQDLADPSTGVRYGYAKKQWHESGSISTQRKQLILHVIPNQRRMSARGYSVLGRRAGVVNSAMFIRIY